MKTDALQRNEYPRSRAVRQLRDLIDRRYTAGEFLPAELELSVQLSVSRGTLRTAMKLLEKEGLLRAQAGRGRFVTSSIKGPKTMMMDAVAVVTHESNPEGKRRQSGTDPFIQMSAIDSIGRAGLHALMVQPERLAEGGLDRFVQERPRGIVLMRRAVESHLAQEIWSSLSNAGIPVVVYGDAPELAEFDSVVSDHAAGAYQLTKWLIERGRKRILRMWHLAADSPLGHRPEWLARRDAGYEQAMKEAGLKPLPAIEQRDMIPRDSTRETFQAYTQLAAGQLLPHLTGANPIDAIMLTSDGVLAPVAAACKMFGKNPKSDILLAGYDNFWQDDVSRQWETTIPAVTVDKRQ